MVASGGLVSAKWEQCIDNAKYPRLKPLPTQTQWHGGWGHGWAVEPIGINHKAANLAILSYQVDFPTTLFS